MDWAASGFTVIGSYLLSKKLRSGWIFLGCAQFFWMAYGIWTVQSIPIVILNVILITTTVRGLRNWSKNRGVGVQ